MLGKGALIAMDPGLNQELFQNRFRVHLRYRGIRKQTASPGIKRRRIMKGLRLLIVLLMILGSAGWAVSGVIPEMKECMRSHTTPQEYEAVLKKYCDPGIIRQAMGLLVIKEPYVLKTEQEGSVICYTVEGTTIGTSSEIPSDVTQVYKVCWDQKRVISLEFFGPKNRIHDEIIPQMKECMRSHTTPREYEAVIKKYADPGIIRQAMGLLVIKEPYVVKTEKEGSVTTYTVEGITVGTSSEIPADVVQVYKVGWKNGKIIAIEFKGPQ